MITRVNIKGASQNSQKLALVVSGGYDATEDNYSYVSSDSVGKHVYMVDALFGTLLWAAGPSSATGINFVAPRMDHAIPSAVSVMDLDSDGYGSPVRRGHGGTALALRRLERPASSITRDGRCARVARHQG